MSRTWNGILFKHAQKEGKRRASTKTNENASKTKRSDGGTAALLRITIKGWILCGGKIVWEGAWIGLGVGHVSSGPWKLNNQKGGFIVSLRFVWKSKGGGLLFHCFTVSGKAYDCQSGTMHAEWGER